jgi:predicted nucleic acid-binding protein
LILVDTTPLVALCDPRDSRHRRALAELQSFEAPAFSTCESVLAEACFHLPHPSQRLRMNALLDELVVTLVPSAIERTHRAQIFEWLLKYGEHEPDWADGCLAVVCGRDRGARVWTYDHEFSTIWRTPDGSKIPLAVK